MLEEKIKEIKEKALEKNVPIIMDDTVSEIEKILLKYKPKTILEIGSGTRIFFGLLLQYSSKRVWRKKHFNSN